MKINGDGKERRVWAVKMFKIRIFNKFLEDVQQKTLTQDI
jgi:hypothetical protein